MRTFDRRIARIADRSARGRLHHHALGGLHRHLGLVRRIDRHGHRLQLRSVDDGRRNDSIHIANFSSQCHLAATRNFKLKIRRIERRLEAGTARNLHVQQIRLQQSGEMNGSAGNLHGAEGIVAYRHLQRIGLFRPLHPQFQYAVFDLAHVFARLEIVGIITDAHGMLRIRRFETYLHGAFDLHGVKVRPEPLPGDRIGLNDSLSARTIRSRSGDADLRRYALNSHKQEGDNSDFSHNSLCFISQKYGKPSAEANAGSILPRHSIRTKVKPKIRKVECRSKRQLDYAETEYLRRSQRYENSRFPRRFAGKFVPLVENTRRM